jgi:hypothetical protein
MVGNSSLFSGGGGKGGGIPGWMPGKKGGDKGKPNEGKGLRNIHAERAEEDRQKALTRAARKKAGLRVSNSRSRSRRRDSRSRSRSRRRSRSRSGDRARKNKSKDSKKKKKKRNKSADKKASKAPKWGSTADGPTSESSSSESESSHSADENKKSVPPTPPPDPQAIAAEKSRVFTEQLRLASRLNAQREAIAQAMKKLQPQEYTQDNCLAQSKVAQGVLAARQQRRLLAERKKLLAELERRQSRRKKLLAKQKAGLELTESDLLGIGNSRAGPSGGALVRNPETGATMRTPSCSVL